MYAAPAEPERNPVSRVASSEPRGSGAVPLAVSSPQRRGSGACVGAEGRIAGAVGERVEREDDARLAHADAVVSDAPGRIVRPPPRARRSPGRTAVGLRDQPAHARERPVAEAPLARDARKPPQVVADPGRAVVEAREVRRRPLPVRIGPVGPAQPAVRRLGDAEQEVAGGHGGAPVASITGHRVGGQQAFADRRRADVPVGLDSAEPGSTNATPSRPRGIARCRATSESAAMRDHLSAAGRAARRRPRASAATGTRRAAGSADEEDGRRMVGRSELVTAGRRV